MIQRVQAFMQWLNQIMQPLIVGNDALAGLPVDRQLGDYPPAQTQG